MFEHDITLLSSHNIHPSAVTASFICAKEECRVEVPAIRKSFLQHLRRNGHSVPDGEAAVLWRAADRCAETFPRSHPLRAKYRTGGARHGQLPSIDGLLVVQGKCCPRCDILFEGDSTLRRHSSMVHNTSISRKTVRSLRTSQCQSLSQKNAAKNLFLVENVEAGNDLRGAAEGTLSAALATYDPGSVPQTHVPAVSDREKSGFVSLAKCQERLDTVGLSLAEAWRLTRALEGGVESGLVSSQTFKQLFVDARDLFRSVDNFRSTLVDISPGGTLEKKKPFHFLNDDEIGDRSLERYARSARILVVIALRVYRDREKYTRISMSPALVRALDDLARDNGSEEETVCMKVHRVLCCIFFEQSSVSGGTVRLFSFAVAACLCVGGETIDRLHFKQGRQVAPVVTAILYAASCCAFLEMRKYSDEERREEVEVEVRSAMCTGAKVGLSVIVDMRSICASVRAEETPENLFENCRRHTLCGFIGGVEVSADNVENEEDEEDEDDAKRIVPSVGRTLRSVHRDLRKAIFVDLLKEKVLPPRFREDCSSIVDDESKLVPGYWALADVRNAEFVSRCNRWIRDEVAPCLPESELDAWTATARDLVPLLLTELHLGGGAPGRGTEIGSMGLRNTPTCKRAMFFSGEELVIHPRFNKSRAIRQCRNFFISRHLDEETSFLFKAFLLLVHPVMVQYAEMNEQSAEFPAGAEGQAILRERSLLRDSFNFGVVKPERVAERIGSVLANYKFPLSFSQFRHWQRGYVKRKGRESYLAKCLSLEGMEEEDIGNGNDDVHQAAVVQAGHTWRTASLFYAQSSRVGDNSAEADEQVLELFRLASYEWQMDIGMRKKAGSRSEHGSTNTPRSEARDLTEQQLSRLAGVVADSVFKRLESVTRSTGCVSDFNHDAEPVENVCGRLFSGENTGNELSMETEPSRVSARRSSGSGENGFDATNALRKVTRNATVEFRSAEQKCAMEAVAARRSDVAVILATGCGKTAVVMGPILYEAGVTMWISPLRALLYETKNRLLLAGICVQRLDQYTEYRGCIGKVLLLAPEEIGRPELHGITNRLSSEGNLNRIVIDEAHIPLFSHTYRSSMVRMQSMADINIDCQRVLLTATAPRAMLERIAPVCGVAVDGLEVIRGDPCRPNLCLNVVRLSDCSMVMLKRRVVVEVQLATARCRSSSGDGARGLVVCLTIADVELFAKAVQDASIRGVCVLKYHSKLSNAERQRASMQWEKAKKDVLTVMIATDGFCTGTDAPNVRSVIVAGGARSLVEFWQGCGRGGRDGMRATITVLYHSGHLRRSCAGDVCAMTEGAGSFDEWAGNDQECRRLRLERFLEGLVSYPTCIDRGAGCAVAELCDVCKGKKGISISGERGHCRVVVSGSKRPSEEELEKAKKKRKESQEQRMEEEERMRRWGRELSKYCTACLAITCLSKEFREEPVGYGRLMQNELRRCKLERCRYTRNVCLRCMQPGHWASQCDVLQSVQASHDSRCRQCFIQEVRGRTIHMDSEYGRANGCPYMSMTKLVLFCYGDARGRWLMGNAFPALKNGGMKTGKEVADWLLTDSVEEPAALFEVMNWAHKEFKLHLFGL